MTVFIISQGPDEDWFSTEEEAFEAAIDWSVSSHGDAVIVSRQDNGKKTILAEVFA